MAHIDIATGNVVANASEEERVGFIRRTYAHLAGAIVVFAIVEALLIQSGVAESFVGFLRTTGSWFWLVILAAFMGVSYVADRWAQSSISKEMQYLGLGVFILAEAVIFMPLIYKALIFTNATGNNVLLSAGLMTLMLAAGITFTAFSTKKDFSFLAPALMVGGFVALGLIVASILFGFELGTIFMAVMVLFAGAVMLYQTSAIIHQYHSEQHVAAALGLFASIGSMFWWILSLVMGLGDD